MRKEQMQTYKGKEAPLTDVEVIAIILYTGPMVSILSLFSCFQRLARLVFAFRRVKSTSRASILCKVRLYVVSWAPAHERLQH